MMIVDYQCIFPTLTNTAACFHTKVVSTSPKSKIPGSLYFEITPENALEQSKLMIKMAIENYPNREPKRVLIPDHPMDAMVGFSVEAIRDALGGSSETVARRGALRQSEGVRRHRRLQQPQHQT